MNHHARDELRATYGFRRNQKCAVCGNRRSVYYIDPAGVCFDCIQHERLVLALCDLVSAIDDRWKKTTPPKQLIEPLKAAKKVIGMNR